jgi:hypothetical protein
LAVVWRFFPNSDFERSFRCDHMPKTLQIYVFAFGLLAILASIGFMSLKQLKWLRWPCPRYGCAFRGFWGRPWLPKNCVYCGLPRENITLDPTKSR